MPRHDLPDGHEKRGTLIDFSEHLRRRAGQTTQDNDANEAELSAWEIYRRAEHSDGNKPQLSRYDLLWLGMILVIGVIVWVIARR